MSSSYTSSMTTEEYTMKKTTKKKAPTLSARVSQIEKELREDTQQNEELISLMEDCAETLSDLGGRITRSEYGQQQMLHQLEGIRQSSLANMDRVTTGLGGTMWRTQEGHSRWIAVLTTQHLESILRGGFGTPKSRDDIRVELKRRQIDREYREGERKPETQDEMARKALDEHACDVLGRGLQIIYHEGEPLALPLWRRPWAAARILWKGYAS